jgi:hypothetical protein
MRKSGDFPIDTLSLHQIINILNDPKYFKGADVDMANNDGEIDFKDGDNKTIASVSFDYYYGQLRFNPDNEKKDIIGGALTDKGNKEFIAILLRLTKNKL